MKNKTEIIPTKEYQWNQNWGNQFAHSDVNLVVAELDAIYETRGEIKPEYVVESSKNKKSVLHNYFEWDNEKAADKWRLGQASALLSRIEVKVIKDGEPKIIKAFQLYKQDQAGGREYKSVELFNDKNIEFVKTMAIADLNRVKNKLSGFSFNAAIKHIDNAIEVLTKNEEVKEIKQIPAKASVAV